MKRKISKKSTSKSTVFTVVLGTLGVSDTEVELFVTVFCVST
jgi:hypothetical protein